MEESKYKSSLRRLILLVAFTGILLITSTYAWFTTQNSIKISGIQGTVGAVEGLEVSLDGENWTNNLALTAENLEAAPGYNVIPEYLDPVSTTGTATDRVAATAGDEAQGISAQQAEVQFYKGLYNAQTDALTEIGATTEGYYAIDLYVKNSSSEESDILKLTNDSSIVIGAEKESTGLQNTTRLGLALYEEKIEDVLADGTTVIGTDWGNIKDVTIWEPNANAHVAEVIRTNNKVTVGNITPGNLKEDSQIPTYALSKASITAGSISNIYTWTTEGIANTGLQKQVTLQTTAEGIMSMELPSVDGTNKFALAGNGIYKLRVYLWLEGQDVDTINHASHGGSVTINFGLTKDIIPISEITLDDDTIDMAAGETTTFGASLNINATEELLWESSDETVATVEPTTVAKLGTLASTDTAQGILLASTNTVKAKTVKIKALKAGETTITAKNTDGSITKECVVTVEDGAKPEGAYLPKGFSVVSEATTTKGYTIQDELGNQYVWVEVPRDATIYNDLADDDEDDVYGKTTGYDTIDEDILNYDLTSDLTSEQLTAIRKELEEYVYKSYGNATWIVDTWLSEEQHGFADADAYNKHKEKMLASVFKNQGFYVGKYETGIADTDPDVVEARTAADKAHINQTPVIQANAYPYGSVTAKQAQELASTKFNGGGYTTSLMFSLQWDLVLKYLETKNAVTYDEITEDSTSWGNYTNNITTNITNPRAKYAIEENSWNWTDGAYGKKDSSKMVILSTGASSDFGKMGIFDLAGNMFEYTLSNDWGDSARVTLRGGGMTFAGSYARAYSFTPGRVASGGLNYGFRVVLF